MKKKILVFLCLIGSLIFTGCDNLVTSSDNSLLSKYKVSSNHLTSSSNTYSTTQEIDYEKYLSKIDNKDTFIILLWQTGCSHCEEFDPIINEIIKYYNLEVYSLNIQDLSDNEYAKLKNKTFVSGTPTTVYIKDGKYESKIVGSKSQAEVINFLVKSNYLEEK